MLLLVFMFLGMFVVILLMVIFPMVVQVVPTVVLLLLVVLTVLWMLSMEVSLNVLLVIPRSMFPRGRYAATLPIMCFLMPMEDVRFARLSLWDA
jgi:hypothetical protein